MFVNKMLVIINDIYYMMKLNILWILFTLRGGVIFGVVPATLTVFGCIRNRLRNQYEGKVYAEFKEGYYNVFKESLPITLGFAVLAVVVFFETAMINGAGQHDFILQLVLKATRMLLVMTGIFLFPVYVHFDLHGSKIWLQPFLFLFVNPIQSIATVIMACVAALLYMTNPLLVLFLGLSLPAYFLMGMMLKRFDKLQEKIAYIGNDHLTQS
ncbi:YesL family protein [Enterococcus sp.]|uniref:YesL family protein n=1 Tax=Enterococcus sp. TaxID=35783 RepID=UPI003C7586EC